MQPNIVTRWWIEATEKDETNKQKNNDNSQRANRRYTCGAFVYLQSQTLIKWAYFIISNIISWQQSKSLSFWVNWIA